MRASVLPYRLRALGAALSIGLGACASGGASPAAPAPAPAPTAPAGPVIREAAPNWHLLDPVADGVVGTGALRAQRELLAGKRPKRVVVVAVIDNGVDTAHAALRGHLWANAREVPGNGKDDDNNGYVDDVRGWNLIGGPDGKNVEHDTFELTRLAVQCEKGGAGPTSPLPAEYRSRCAEIEADFARKRGEAQETLTQVRQIEGMMLQITPYLRRAAHADSLTVANVTAIQTTNDTVRQARAVFLQLAANGITPSEIEDAKKAYASQLQYGYNKDFDPRPIVRDGYPDTAVRRYGNKDVTGDDPMHGTHVAGIIAGAAGGGTSGIAQSVRIMAIRTVPDGDERDKDVANAIRYAVDNGAQIINMSFGKAYSPYKGLVDAAVKYADSKGVLMVHAAGNEGANVADDPSFPTPVYLGGGRAANWIEVGASSWNGRDSLAANFSNYGKSQVDIFAPGVAITSTVPGGGYKREDGTSMASPVVAGVAALVMSYFPSLTAADVKRVILESATPLADQLVVRPGPAGGQVRFGDLSATGGVVNAYNAIKLAERLTTTTP